jgi:hypothetical protein
MRLSSDEVVMSDKFLNDKSFDTFLTRHLQTQTPYIDDEGFTALLMERLPAPKRINTWLEKLIVWLPVSLISLVVLAQFPWRSLVQSAYAWVLTMDVASLVSVVLVLSITCLLAPLSFLMKDRFI